MNSVSGAFLEQLTDGTASVNVESAFVARLLAVKKPARKAFKIIKQWPHFSDIPM